MSFIYNIVWILIPIIVIIFSIYFTIKTNFIQFNIIKMIKSLKQKTNEGISTYKVLSLSLAGRIGVGSLAGTALAIYLGGPGSVFWMWVITLITCSITYIESYLGNLYHNKEKDIYVGGPSYYIEKGLGYKKTAKLYSILIIIGYIVGFLGIQSNTVSTVITHNMNISPLLIGIILTIISGIAIMGGIKEITDITGKLVPIMSLFFLIVSGYILVLNVDKIIPIIKYIIESAFNFNSAKYGILSSFIVGLQRSIFATESGIGTSAISSAIASDSPKKQGFVQIIGVYFTIFVICTVTSLIILLSKYNIQNLNDINGIEITLEAYNFFLGNFGKLTVIITIILFAISTIISGYYYGEANLKKLFEKNYSNILKIVTLIILLISSVTSSKFIWNLVDIFVGILILINVICIFKLRKEVK